MSETEIHKCPICGGDLAGPAEKDGRRVFQVVEVDSDAWDELVDCQQVAYGDDVMFFEVDYFDDYDPESWPELEEIIEIARTAKAQGVSLLMIVKAAEEE